MSNIERQNSTLGPFYEKTKWNSWDTVLAFLYRCLLRTLWINLKTEKNYLNVAPVIKIDYFTWCLDLSPWCFSGFTQTWLRRVSGVNPVSVPSDFTALPALCRVSPRSRDLGVFVSSLSGLVPLWPQVPVALGSRGDYLQSVTARPSRVVCSGQWHTNAPRL